MHIFKLFCLILVHSNTFQAFLIYNLMYQLQCSSINFCRYNFVLNKAPNNNDVMCVANTMLKVPNSNDATHIGNNVCLTAMGAQQFSMVTIQPSHRKANLPETRDNYTVTRKVPVDRNELCPGKKWRLYICPVVQMVG